MDVFYIQKLQKKNFNSFLFCEAMLVDILLLTQIIVLPVKDLSFQERQKVKTPLILFLNIILSSCQPVSILWCKLATSLLAIFDLQFLFYLKAPF